MPDQPKTNQQLTEENAALKDRIRELESAEQERDARLQAILAHNPLLISEVDADGRYLLANQAVGRFFKLAPSQIIGKTCGELLPAETARVFMDRITRVKKTRKPLNVEDSLKTDEGVRHFITTLFPVNDAAGNIGSVGCIAHDITERKRTEETLKESEEKYRILVETAEESIFIAQDGMIKFCNKTFSDLTGYTLETMTTMPFTDIIHPDDQHMVFDRHIQRMEGKDVPSRYTFRFLDTRGNIRWADMNVALISWTGKPASLCLATDITEHRLVQESLRKSEEKFRHLFERAGEGILVVRGETLEFVNPALERILGHSMDRLTSEPFTTFIHPADQEMLRDRHLKRMRGESVDRSYDFRVITDDGTVKWVTINSQVIHWEGAPANLSFIMDITERKLAEEALQKSEKRYRDFAELLPGTVFEANSEGTITFANKTGIACFGYNSDDVVDGVDLLDTVAHHDREKAMENAKRIMNREMTGSNEYTMQRKDGTCFPALIHSTAIIQDGNPVGLRGFIIDITDRKRAEEEKLNLERRLAQAHKMESIGTLAGGIAHDFNNLLMGIQGNASLMRLDLDPSHPHSLRLKNIEEHVAAGADLTNQLLGFSRGGRYDVKPLSINAIIKKSSAMFGRTRKEISIHLKPAKDPCIVEADRAQMEQVLMNLFVNAWHAMPGGGNIFIGTEKIFLDDTSIIYENIRPGPFVKITLTDTGAGMDEKTKKRIFDPFFTTKGMGRGSGLGLAMVYGIIKGHGGMINVYSEPGQGTTFTLYIPASGEYPVEEQKSTGETLRGTETILLIDDEKIILDVSREMLESLGYRVYAAGSGREAIAIYMKKKDEIDLVILDMIMPDISGSDTFDQLREINPEVTVLLASGYSIKGQAGAIMDRGCDGFIQKPFHLEKLSQIVREVLDN